MCESINVNNLDKIKLSNMFQHFWDLNGDFISFVGLCGCSHLTIVMQSFSEKT